MKQRDVYLFLDFDGVLNDFGSQLIHLDKLDFLIKLIKSYGLVSNIDVQIHIVFSTSHRIFKTLQELIDDISAYDLLNTSLINSFDVVGDEEYIIVNEKSINSRYKEIMNYINNSNKNINIKDVLILDDCSGLFMYQFYNSEWDNYFHLYLNDKDFEEKLLENNVIMNDEVQQAQAFSKQLLILDGLTKQDALIAIAKLF